MEIQEIKEIKSDKPGVIGIFEFSGDKEEIIEASSPGNCSPMDCNPGN